MVISENMGGPDEVGISLDGSVEGLPQTAHGVDPGISLEGNSDEGVILLDGSSEGKPLLGNSEEPVISLVGILDTAVVVVVVLEGDSVGSLLLG